MRQAIDKASAAYGHSIESDLAKAITHLREHPQRLEVCMEKMGMQGLSRAALWTRIRAVERAAA